MNIGENFCQSVDILVNNAIDKVKFDKTIVCTIVNDSEKKQGKYIVSNGEIEFEAYTSDASLSEGNNVYVNIPLGDWNEQKLIVSKKTKDQNIPITYTDSFDSFVELTDNIITIDNSAISLLANGNNITVTRPLLSSFTPQHGYTRLGLKASFQSWLKDLNINTGNYGIRLYLTTDKKDDKGVNIIRVCTLDCSDMIGNPYNFESFYVQKKLFNIEDIKEISNIVVEFFQDNQSFKISPNSINCVDTTGYAPNLFVKDIVITLGYDIGDFENDTLIIFSSDSTSYKKGANEDNHKAINARWIHKVNDQIKVISEKDNIPHILTWYRYKIGVGSDTVWSGVDWEKLSTQSYEKKSEDSNEYEWKYEVFDNILKREKATKENENPTAQDCGILYNKTILAPDYNNALEKVKAILEYENEIIYSDVLTFSNEEGGSLPAPNTTQALSINCEDGSNGNYFIYGIDGTILNRAQSSSTKTLMPYFKNSINDEDACLTEAEQIEWIIPRINTMIQIDDSCYTNIKDGNDKSNTSYYHFIREGNKNGSIDTKDIIQQYKIRSHYNQSYVNNTIQCIVTRNNIKYVATKELSFGPMGTSGTDYTFILDFEPNKNAITLGDEGGLTVKASLYDHNGQDIDIAKQENIIIKWELLRNDNNYLDFPSQNDNKPKNEKYIIQGAGLKGRQTVPEDNYVILEATLEEWGNYTLKAHLPIPIRRKSDNQIDDQMFLSGITTLSYNSLGQLDQYFQVPYILYNKAGEIEDCQWDVIVPKSPIDNSVNPFTPKISIDSKNQAVIIFPSFYAEEALNKICLVCKNNNIVFWSQPLYVTQNKYPSSIINNWNGELTIDKANNSILSSKVVAGKKNDDNTFSGVIMGDWKSTNDNDIDGIGLFGFYKGTSSFGFKNDGTAFIGKSGGGRLHFDGERSTIKNAGETLIIDFDDSYIKLIEPNKETPNEIILNAKATNTGYPFKIGEYFKVQWDGSVEAENGSFTGVIKSEEGEIGGWKIETDQLKSKVGGTILDEDGNIYIEGKLTAHEGTFTSTSGGITLEGYLNVVNGNGYLGEVSSNIGGIGAINSVGVGMYVINGGIIKATGSNAGMKFGDQYVSCEEDTVVISKLQIKDGLSVSGETTGIYATLV